MDQFSIFNEKLIQCVRHRPALYDKTVPEYKDKELKEELWAEICMQLVPGWENLAPKDQLLQGKELQRKWQNLRTCFARELKRQKCMKLTPTGDTRKTYVYYQQLLFLLPTFRRSSALKKYCTVDEDEDHELSNEDDNYNMVRTYTKETATTDSSSVYSTESGKRNIKYDDAEPGTSTGKKSKLDNDEIDEDKYFLLSLVPSFKKLNNEQKFEVKIKFLRVLRELQVPFDRDSLAPSPLPSNILSPSAGSNVRIIENGGNSETARSGHSNGTMSEKSFDGAVVFFNEDSSDHEFYCDTKNSE